MNLPGFSGESSIYTSNNRYYSLANAASHSAAPLTGIESALQINPAPRVSSGGLFDGGFGVSEGCIGACSLACAAACLFSCKFNPFGDSCERCVDRCMDFCTTDC
jgi:hypothetical protein